MFLSTESWVFSQYGFVHEERMVGKNKTNPLEVLLPRWLFVFVSWWRAQINATASPYGFLLHATDQ
jgi:hypothetical protein